MPASLGSDFHGAIQIPLETGHRKRVRARGFLAFVTDWTVVRLVGPFGGQQGAGLGQLFVFRKAFGHVSVDGQKANFCAGRAMEVNPAPDGCRARRSVIPNVSDARVTEASGDIGWIIDSLGNMGAGADGIEKVSDANRGRWRRRRPPIRPQKRGKAGQCGAKEIQVFHQVRTSKFGDP